MASPGFGERSLNTVLLMPWNILDIGRTESYSLSLKGVGTAVGSSALDSAGVGSGVGVSAGCWTGGGGGGACSSSVGSSGGPALDPQATAKASNVATATAQAVREKNGMCIAARSEWRIWRVY